LNSKCAFGCAALRRVSFLARTHPHGSAALGQSVSTPPWLPSIASSFQIASWSHSPPAMACTISGRRLHHSGTRAPINERENHPCGHHVSRAYFHPALAGETWSVHQVVPSSRRARRARHWCTATSPSPGQVNVVEVTQTHPRRAKIMIPIEFSGRGTQTRPLLRGWQATIVSSGTS
jgi:hypothetical protein